jgi:hypothetical protein
MRILRSQVLLYAFRCFFPAPSFFFFLPGIAVFFPRALFLRFLYAALSVAPYISPSPLRRAACASRPFNFPPCAFHDPPVAVFTSLRFRYTPCMHGIILADVIARLTSDDWEQWSAHPSHFFCLFTFLLHFQIQL